MLASASISTSMFGSINRFTSTIVVAGLTSYTSPKGSGQDCPLLRALNAHILIVRVLRARRASGCSRHLLHDNAAAGMNILARQPPRFLTDNERHHVGNVLGDTKSLQR